MDPDYVISLFDSSWFSDQSFIKHSTKSNVSEESINIHINQEDSSQPTRRNLPNYDGNFTLKSSQLVPKFSKQPSILIRSKSDQLNSMTSFHSDWSSPTSVLVAPHLQTILSGKEVKHEEALQGKRLNSTDNALHAKLPKNVNRRRGRKLRSMSKSLSDLEFEELKGFMDLGFVFSEEDKDSRLVDIIPGLHRLGKTSNGESDEHAVTRPYLSEAWQVMEEERRMDALNNWRVPAPENEIDMKDNLKWWAQTVASAVR